MLYRRLLAGFLVLGVLIVGAAPVSGQKEDDKKKDEDKPKDKGEKVSLAWKFEEGKSFYQKMKTETEQSMKVMNNDVTQKQVQTFYFKWTPKSKKGDSWTIEQQIVGVQMEIDIGGSRISYDSTKPEAGGNNPLADFFKALKGATFTITLDTKKLEVTDVEGRDEFVKQLTNANPAMKPLLDVILSKDALKEMAEPTFAVVPTKEGEKKWTKKTSLNMGPIGKYDNTYNYTYDGKDDKGRAKIRVATELKYTPPADTVGQGGLPFKIKSADLKSKNATGNILFDGEKGRVEKVDMKLTLTGDLVIDIGGQQTKVTLNQQQRSTVETTSDNPLEKEKDKEKDKEKKK